MPFTSTEAKRLGLSMYFTGKPCKNNHVTSRYASSKECFFCRKDKNSNPNLKEKQKKWTTNNYENILTASKKRYERNKAWQQLRGQAKWVTNKEKVSQTNKPWADKNDGVWTFYAAKRRCALKSRMPSWANLDEIKRIYENCPEGHHVDHIIPLQGKFVSGLHIETNLQYLPASENLKKHNKYIME